MDHDPFCKAYYPDLLEVERCMWCMVIRRVREDERNNIDLDVEHWVGYNNGYTQGYMDGYSDAEKEFTNPCLFCGHDDFSTYICDECKSLNEDNEVMPLIEDIENDGWYTNGVTYMTKEHVVKQWNELFDANPWLEGFAADKDCGLIDCCQEVEPQDWLVFDQVTTLLWLAGLQDEKVLTKDLIQKFGGTQ